MLLLVRIVAPVLAVHTQLLVLALAQQVRMVLARILARVSPALLACKAILFLQLREQALL